MSQTFKKLEEELKSKSLKSRKKKTIKQLTTAAIIGKTNYYFFARTIKIILGSEKNKHSKILAAVHKLLKTNEIQEEKTNK